MIEKKHEHTDIRNIRTNKQITQGFLTLITEKPFKTITVNDICSKAGISRGTFYRHFVDKYDLLRRLLQKLSSEIKAEAEGGDFENEISITLELIEKYEPMIRNVIFEQQDEEIRELVYSVYTAALHKEVCHSADAMNVPNEIVAEFWAAGLAYLEMMWMQGNLKYSREEFATHLGAMARTAGIYH